MLFGRSFVLTAISIVVFGVYLLLPSNHAGAQDFSRLFHLCENQGDLSACQRALQLPTDPQTRDRLQRAARQAQQQGGQRANTQNLDGFLSECRGGTLSACDRALQMPLSAQGRSIVEDARRYGQGRNEYEQRERERVASARASQAPPQAAPIPRAANPPPQSTQRPPPSTASSGGAGDVTTVLVGVIALLIGVIGIMLKADMSRTSKINLITQVSPLKAPSPGSAGFQPCSGSAGASRMINGLASS